MVKPKLNKFRIIILILIIVIIGGASFAGWYIWQKNQSKESQQIDPVMLQQDNPNKESQQIDPVMLQQDNPNITRHTGLNILQTDWSSWPGASSKEYYSHYYSSVKKGQEVAGGFIVDEISNDYIKLTIGGASYDGPFEKSEVYNDPDIQLQIILNNGDTKEFNGLQQDAGTDYSLLYIK